MKIEPPADDLGLQHLKATDRAKGRVEQVDHVERYARIAPSEERRDQPRSSLTQPGSTTAGAAPDTPEPQRRRRERRNDGDRRQQQTPTLIDTRSPHERRTKRRRNDDRTTNEAHQPPGGIDELI